MALTVALSGARTEQVKAVPQQKPSNTTVSVSADWLLNEISIVGRSASSNAYLVRSFGTDVQTNAVLGPTKGEIAFESD